MIHTPLNWDLEKNETSMTPLTTNSKEDFKMEVKVIGEAILQVHLIV